MQEIHFSDRIGWLRAAVLGANDGIVSVASLIVGVAASAAGRPAVLIAAMAGLVAGAMSMAAGEYVSVSSQADSEKADLERERLELENDYDSEVDELAGIYRDRGLDEDLARQVALSLMKYNALEAHARDELGHSEISKANPVQAAFASAASFIAGAALPVATAAIAPEKYIIETVSVSTLIFLGLLGALSAHTGGASVLKGIVRVSFWGVGAMGVTALVGYLFGVAVN